MGITRSITIEDIEASEVAHLFCEMGSEEQAEVFRHIGEIAKGWPGAGWCQQSYAIANNLEPGGRAVITKLAEHVLGYDDMLNLIHRLSVIVNRGEVTGETAEAVAALGECDSLLAKLGDRP